MLTRSECCFSQLTSLVFRFEHGNWQENDCLELTLDMSVRKVYANPLVRENIGKVALMRGPLVYCLEEADNGSLLGVGIKRDATFETAWNPDKLGGIVELYGSGYRTKTDADTRLYRDTPPVREEISLTFIPYFTWANRGENEMTVYVRDLD